MMDTNSYRLQPGSIDESVFTRSFPDKDLPASVYWWGGDNDWLNNNYGVVLVEDVE